MKQIIVPTSIIPWIGLSVIPMRASLGTPLIAYPGKQVAPNPLCRGIIASHTSLFH